jgi:hypothetical protein
MPSKKISQKFIDPVYHGVVGLLDGANHKDADWFSIFYPSEPGVYGGGILQITIPNGSVSKFGRIKINGVHYPPVQNSIKPDECTIEVKIPDMLYGCDFPVRIEGYINEDNVYNLKFTPGKKVGDAPEPDKLDNVSTNPFGKPNNDNKANAAPLANGPISFKLAEYIWSEVKKDNLYTYYEINIKDLNFHTCGDEDWFKITPPPGLTSICGHMMCTSPITLSCTNGGDPVNVLVSVYDNLNNIMNENVLSGLDIECANPSGGYPLYVKLWGGGAPIKYDLKLSVKIPVDLEKYIAKCDEMWKWVQELKYPPIKLNQNWWCEWGTDPVGFTIDWTNNGGFNWSEGGMSFLMQGIAAQGSSISMQLFNSQGDLIIQSSTQDLSSPGTQANQIETFQGYSVLSLEQPNLREGTYFLMLSGGAPQPGVQPNLTQGNYSSLPGNNVTRNEIQLLIPRNLLSANLPAIEDFGITQGNFSTPVSSAYSLIPAFTNQTLIFR